jgi:predicted DNA-binding transcriptional regulator AlpA
MTKRRNWLSREGSAAFLRVSVRTFDRLMHEPGAPKPLRLGRSVRYDEDDLIAFENLRAGGPARANGEAA